MGASIYWKPTRNDGVLLDVGLRSEFVAAMNRAFGTYPWKLAGAQFETLNGMRAAWDGQDGQAFTDLMDAIERFGSIEVWPEY